MIKIFNTKINIEDPTKVKNFDDAIKVITDFIYVKNFKKAKKALDEIEEKENSSFNLYTNDVYKLKLDKIHEKRLNLISKLKLQCDKKETEYLNIIYKNKKKAEIKITSNKINDFILKWDFSSSISLINSLIQTYNNDNDIIEFVWKQKKIINKKIDDYKKKREKEVKKDTYLQALELIWEIKNIPNIKKTDDKNDSIFFKIKNFFSLYYNLKKRLIEKRLFDEVDLLLKIHSDKNELIAKNKLSQIHSWISKELTWNNVNWYDMYWKILWADKISWDSIWLNESKEKYDFYIWDATWHWIKAWFIISQLSKKFNELIWKKVNLENIVMNINNSLKQDLKSWNFITTIFYSIDIDTPEQINFVWMWHEPMFVYRKSSNSVEKIIPWWLAAWIRIINNIDSVKVKKILMEDWDILISYTDWIVEAKNEKWEMYSIDRMWEKLKEFANIKWLSSKELYKLFLLDLKNFVWWRANFLDDLTILIIKRDKNKEIITKEEEIKKIILENKISLKYKKNLKWKSFDEIRQEIDIVQRKSKLENILKHLTSLYKTWEILKLKQDCIRYIREWFIDKKIIFFLKEAIRKESVFKVRLKEQKLNDKYNILKELYKKWNYDAVITECINIINKDWNI